MRARNYLIVCVVTAAAVALAVLYAPGLDDAIERQLLTFLSTNAR
ncbi:MAG: hypothetical protein R3E86_01450 [Pseudomonadales bacterium]